MYPYFEIFDGFLIYTFGLTLSICFFLFIWMLRKLAHRFSYDFSLFKNNLLWFFLSTFFFSRAFYVIFKWTDLKYIDSPFEFFVMSDFNFSLYGAMFGFFLVLLIALKFSKESFIKYLDGVMLSFLFVLIIGTLGAFLGGQIYGKETHIGIELTYPNISPVPYQVAIFPLPIVYSIFFFILFCVLYMLSLFVHIRGFIGYVGLIAFACIVLILEFFTGKFDVLKFAINVNFNQIISLGLLGYTGYELYKLLQVNTGSKKVTIIK